MNEVRLKLSPPWITYIHKLQALFGPDPDIEITVDETAPTVTLHCGNGDKVTLLQQLLPCEKTYGTVILQIVIDGVPSNRAFTSNKEMF